MDGQVRILNLTPNIIACVAARARLSLTGRGFDKIIHIYYLVRLRILVLFYMDVDAVNNVTSVPESADGVLAVCSGDSISITCAHDNTAGEQTRWMVTGAVNCDVIASHISRTERLCGPFQIIMISDNSGSTVTSIALISDTSSVNGITVQCFDGGLSSSTEVGSLNVSVLGKGLDLFCFCYVRPAIARIYHFLL